MKAMYGTDSMGQTAENVAEQYDVVARRPGRVRGAIAAEGGAARGRPGASTSEIAPSRSRRRRATAKRVDQDEFIRPDTTIEALAKLKPAFRTDGKGSVTAGNSSGPQRRRAALLSRRTTRVDAIQARRRGRASSRPRLPASSRGSWAWGPVPATRLALERAGLTLDQIDVIELNEAFAAQSLACLRELGLADDDPRVNPNGGAIALGHPLGMSGARLAADRDRRARADGQALCAVHDVHRRGAGHGDDH